MAERIAREAKALHFAPSVLPMDGYPVDRLPAEPLTVFVASTAGQGEMPDNMKRFWRFLLRKGLPADSLAAVRCAVVGLGDSGYVDYNVAAKKLDRRLLQLGAAPLVERCLCDDQHFGGYEAALDPWLSKQLWPALLQLQPLPPGSPALQDLLAGDLLGEPRYRVTTVGPEARAEAGAPGFGLGAVQQAAAAAAAFRRLEAQALGMPPTTGSSDAAASAPGPYSAHNSKLQQSQQPFAPPHGPWRPYFAPLLRNERMTAAAHFQDTRHLEFDLSGSGLTYEPGDLLAVLPHSPAEAVDALLSRLGLDGDAVVRVELAAAAAPGASPAATAAGSRDGKGGSSTAQAPPAAVTAPLRALVQGVLDVAGCPPRRFFFQVLRRFATAAHEVERLAYFASAAGRDDLYDYNRRERRTVLEVRSGGSSARQRCLHATPPVCHATDAPQRAREVALLRSFVIMPNKQHASVLPPAVPLHDRPRLLTAW